MDKLKEKIANFDWSLKSIIKVSIIFVIIVIAISIAIGAFNYITKDLFNRWNGNFAQEIFQSDGSSVESAKSSRSITSFFGSPVIETDFNKQQGGADAEKYEKRNYNARYQTRKFERVCKTVVDLKSFKYVVFDNSNKNKNWCDYNFRVEVAYENEIITKLKDLNPKEFSINTSTLERGIEYNDSELAMLKRRMISITETLKQAEISFNSLIAQATRKGDVATLSEVINNKISTIDRLNQQLLNTKDRIDRLTKNKSDMNEQIEYAHFTVSVERVVFIDMQNVANLWKEKVQEMFTKFNSVLLALSVGLITFVLVGIQLIVQTTVVIVGIALFAKVIWVIVKKIWKLELKKRQSSRK